MLFVMDWVMDFGKEAWLLGSQYIGRLQTILDAKYQVKALNDVALCQGGLLLVDLSSIEPSFGLAQIRAMRARSGSADSCVLVVLSESGTLKHRMSAYEAGCDDYLSWEDIDELPTRIDRLVINRIANQQLKAQLQQAKEMAYIAMSDTSDLGVNIQFLLDVNQCNNLDEVGMRLFQALRSYGVHTSLQMRSQFGIKNMEANGMAKELESAMLMECRDSGRYVDFGKRSIMNYGSVSLLVKNMPVDDDHKYGAIKDNVFSLLQGVDARVQALDMQKSLQFETELVNQMAVRMRELVSSVDDGYQNVMRQIANVVDTMSEGVENRLQFLGMDEYQEKAILEIMYNGVEETGKIFSNGLRMDEGLQQFLSQVDQALEADGETISTQKMQCLSR
jgi:CheY-like chemotaxis protein